MQKLTLILFVFITLAVNAQQFNLPLNHEIQNRISEISAKDKISDHSFKPMIINDNEFVTIQKQLYPGEIDTLIKNKVNKKIPNWFARKLLAEDFFTVKEKDFTFFVNPLVNLQLTQMMDTAAKFTLNTRAIEAGGAIGSKFSFYTSFYENQAFLVPYQNEFANTYQIVPGQGASKIFKKNGHDFSRVEGYISYTPFKFLNVQLGRGKHFVGNGYRSLLLSDNAYVYPFVRATYSHEKFQYNVLFTEFESFTTKYYNYHPTKHGSFKYLSYMPLDNIELGFFEGTVWFTIDGGKKISRPPFWYFVPLPFTNLADDGHKNSNSIVWGLNAKYVLFQNLQFYGQVAKYKADIVSKNGYQAGVKCFDLFFRHLPKQKLLLQLEYNTAQPYMYSSLLNNQSYSHYNQPLASGLGAGYNEKILIANYMAYNFFVDVKLNFINQSKDTANSNFGSNVLINAGNATDINATKMFGNITNIMYATVSAGYIINRKTNLKIFGGMMVRNYKNDLTNEKTKYIFAGLMSDINNYYFDF